MAFVRLIFVVEFVRSECEATRPRLYDEKIRPVLKFGKAQGDLDDSLMVNF
jgi:hypothetical protein